MPKAKKYIIFINGLGDGTPRKVELAFLKRFSQLGYDSVPAKVDWYAKQSFAKTFDQLSKEFLEPIIADAKQIVLIGSSAGGSMAINLFSQLQNKPNIYAINLGGRLARGNLTKKDYRTLDFAAHIGKTKQSQLFYESVIYCEDEAIPALKNSNFSHLRIMMPFADEIVPLQTMKIQGVQEIRIPAIGHIPAALIGGQMIPKLLRSLE